MRRRGSVPRRRAIGSAALLLLALSASTLELHAAHEHASESLPTSFVLTPHHQPSTLHLESWRGAVVVRCPACLQSAMQHARPPEEAAALPVPTGERTPAVAGVTVGPAGHRRLPLSRGPPPL